jgi:acyl-CoA reductase-like NAD-dependent aldehyde dehydrogenase
MKHHYREFYINGEWTAPVSERESISVLNPSTEEEIARIPQGDASDIEAAVRAAKNALPSWSSTSTEYRADLIEKISTALDGRRAEFAELISRDEGMPLSHSDALQAGLPITTFADTARNLRAFQFEERIEAVEMANDTAYGLAGAVWSGSRERAIEVARRLRTGQVQINGGDYNPRAPFGGYKQSGNGREFGPHALSEFTELKAMQLDG